MGSLLLKQTSIWFNTHYILIAKSMGLLRLLVTISSKIEVTQMWGWVKLYKKRLPMDDEDAHYGMKPPLYHDPALWMKEIVTSC